MTDLYFTADGGGAEVEAAMDAVKELLADRGVLERMTDEEGRSSVRDPRNVLGPQPGRAAQQVDHGGGDFTVIPEAGRVGTWYLALRTDRSLDELAALTGFGWDRVVNGRLELLPGVLLHLPPPATGQVAWDALMAEFESVLGVWA